MSLVVDRFAVDVVPWSRLLKLRCNDVAVAGLPPTSELGRDIPSATTGAVYPFGRFRCSLTCKKSNIYS